MSHLTPDELQALAASGLDASKPYGWRDVSQTQLSLARHSGRIVVNGARYVYFGMHDELWREDVLTWLRQRRLQRDRDLRADELADQQGLFDE